MYIRIANDTPEVITLEQLRAEYPNWSPPKTMLDRVLNKRNVYRVKETKGGRGQVKDGFERVNGVWQTKWRDMTAQELAEAQSAKRNAIQVALHQFRLALIEGDHIASVRSVVQGLTGKQRARLEARLEYQQAVGRSEGWVNQLLDAAGLSESDKDALFDAAQSL